MKAKTKLKVLLFGALVALSFGSANAATLENGIGFNGVNFNGIGFNGIGFNGIGFNGIGFNGIGFNGIGFNGLGTNRASLDAAQNHLGDQLKALAKQPLR